MSLFIPIFIVIIVGIVVIKYYNDMIILDERFFTYSDESDEEYNESMRLFDISVRS